MVTNEVKRRLDYQIALQDLNRRMEQEHLVNWVEKNVIGSITAQQVSLVGGDHLKKHFNNHISLFWYDIQTQTIDLHIS